MTAQPVFDEPGPDDPAQILRVLPEQYHAGFLAEYADAVDKARRPEGYAALAALLRLWRLRAEAYADPGFRERLVAVQTGNTNDDVPVEQLAAEWPPA
ncbi:DUF6247 family protein [Actinopolymorpha rutila]|uniref:Uncharacterized protein n=1 Tax=Actinopolymorpha rutila TaxID=446787 RepID=A0A852ZM26_9ACTN|nr:DUF6247 family protein [Actinopolymorpha rutila]NYH93313.1 hypothetical protein [Actinopolymorpha rutila]